VEKKGGIVFTGIGIVTFIASLMIPKFIPHLSLEDAYLWVYSTIAQAFAAMIALVAMFVVLAIQVWRASRRDLIQEMRQIMLRWRPYAYFDQIYVVKKGSEAPRRPMPEEMPELERGLMEHNKWVIEDSSDEEIVGKAKHWVNKIKTRQSSDPEGSGRYGPGERRLLQAYKILTEEENAYNKTLILLKKISLAIRICYRIFSSYDPFVKIFRFFLVEFVYSIKYPGLGCCRYRYNYQRRMDCA